MELEDLKSIWKSSEPVFQPKNEQEIARMLKGRSISIVNKLKRNVWFELVFTIVVSVALLIYALSLPKGAMKWTSISLLLMCIASTVFYVKKLSILNHVQGINENLHDTISFLIKNLTTYLRFYKNSYTVLYPIYFLLGLLFSFMEKGTDVVEFLSQPTTIIYLLFMGGLFFLISFWFARWFLKKLYGNHLEKLKNIMYELNQQ
ncbi:MAG TPA: hypothetical protein VEW65_06365 [Chryseolinea sp.]|nr:hypothetical protein [Chryseolinea sp.]HZI25412.1 hypothetical protein [Chryseolinea sp.]